MIIFMVAFKKSYKTAALGVVNFLVFSCPEIGVNKIIVDEFLKKGWSFAWKKLESWEKAS